MLLVGARELQRERKVLQRGRKLRRRERRLCRLWYELLLYIGCASLGKY
jgi:hypothetical protein